MSWLNVTNRFSITPSRARARHQRDGHVLHRQVQQELRAPSASSTWSSPSPLSSTLPPLSHLEQVQGRTGRLHQHNMRIMQINLQKSKTPTACLNDQVFDVALVQEPNLNKKDRINIVSGSRRTFHGPKARAAVIAERDLHIWPVETFTTRDLAVVSLQLKDNNEYLFMASAYLDIIQPAPSKELKDLVSYCNLKQIPLLIGMDSNAHSTMWGEENTNRRGTALEDWILGEDLFVHNRGRTPTLIPDNGTTPSIIDITITNHLAAGMLQRWQVDVTTPSLSDHRFIRYSIAEAAISEPCYKRNLSKVDWCSFRNKLGMLESPLSEWSSSCNVDKLANNILGNIVEALDHVAPERRVLLRDKNVWWSDSLSDKTNSGIFSKKGTIVKTLLTNIGN